MAALAAGAGAGETFNERAVDVPGVSPKRLSVTPIPAATVTTERDAAAAATLATVIKARLAKKRAAAAAAADEKGDNGNNVAGEASGNNKERTTSSGSLSGPLEKGSMCNKFAMETESSSLSYGQMDEEEARADLEMQAGRKRERMERGGQDDDDDDDNGGAAVGGARRKKRKKPPKIWISKSASMEHDDLD